MRVNDNGLTFEQFMAEVDNHMMLMCGLTHEDISDYLYIDAWYDDSAPVMAAEDALLEAGFEF